MSITAERRVVLLVESDAAMARVVERALAPRTVATCASIEQALRALRGSRRVALVISNYDLRDGTAGRLFALAARSWPGVRRILYVDRQKLGSPYVQRALTMAHAVVNDFGDARAVIDAELARPGL